MGYIGYIRRSTTICDIAAFLSKNLCLTFSLGDFSFTVMCFSHRSVSPAASAKPLYFSASTNLLFLSWFRSSVLKDDEVARIGGTLLWRQDLVRDCGVCGFEVFTSLERNEWR